jgi:hypothetical protein
MKCCHAARIKTAKFIVILVEMSVCEECNGVSCHAASNSVTFARTKPIHETRHQQASNWPHLSHACCWILAWLCSSTLNTKPIRASDMWVHFYQTPLRYNPEDRTIHRLRCKTRKFSLLMMCSTIQSPPSILTFPPGTPV